jgi:soluble lytic murein transglycosylase
MLAFVLVTLSAAVSQAGEDLLVKQRAAFLDAYPQAELGTWSPTAKQQQLLSAYTLWPDLRAAYLKARVSSRNFSAADEADVLEFLKMYGALRPGRDLRYRYATTLASTGRLADYLQTYQQYYQGLDIAKLDCLALQAEIQAGRQGRILRLASDLWLVGSSQDDACDPVFDFLRANGMLTEDLYRDRFALAIEARDFSLARYLAKSLDTSHVDEANLWISARDRPSDFVASYSTAESIIEHQAQLLYAIERIAYRDPESASRHWQRLRAIVSFPSGPAADLSQYIALWAARRNSPIAPSELANLPPEAVSPEVLRWKARSNLRRHDWISVIDNISAMPVDEQRLEEWQYWQAKSLRGISQEDHALELLNQLSAERSYYGFLAADEIGLDYSFGHASLAIDPEIMSALESNVSLVRARELFMVGLESNGRSEWDAVVGSFNGIEKVQAALLAQKWGWHSRAIAAAAAAGQYDDLDLRYPLAFEESFSRYSADAGIAQSWAYGVARSESLFMADVRSSAGAIGIMQLMPDTGRATAREIQLPYSGVATLVDPGSNIRLGTTYLGKMLSRFDGNTILATAAYNAGPGNVATWLPASEVVDARIWIENIPFNETRQYVRRVLATDTIFHWRMTGEMRRLSSALPEIAAPATRIVRNY